MSTLLIDDRRDIPCDQVARTFNQGIAALAARHWDLVYLDHDLGDFSGPQGRERTGYHIALWLAQHAEHLPGKVVVVSANPVGAKNIQDVLARLYG